MVQQKIDVPEGIRIQKEPVFQTKDRFQFTVLTVLSVMSTTAFLVSWFKLEAWQEFPLTLLVLSGILIVLLGDVHGRWFVLPKMRKPKTLVPRPGLRAAVVTTIVPNIEPLCVLEQTLEALVSIDYPHETWVLDEGDDERVKQLCLKKGIFHYSRKHRPEYQKETGPFRKATKYGNYNAWLHEIGFKRFEFITVFDPDHVPEPNFLTKVLGYFGDPSIVYVQAPQVYSNQQVSFIARGAAEESYEFYSSGQMAAYGMGYPIIVGCHNTHRVSALQEMGGFPPHDAEDLLLTLFYRSRSWEGVYVPEVLARGLAPSEWSSYLNQQRRWARSIFDIKFRIAPAMLPKLSMPARFMSVLHGFHYLHKSFLLPVTFILMTILLGTGEFPKVVNTVTATTGGLTLVLLHISERFRQRFYLNRSQERGLHWRAGVLQLAKWPYVILAFFDVIFNRRFPYTITPKVPGGTRSSFALWPHLPVVIVIGIAWIIGFWWHGTLPIKLQILAGSFLVGILLILITERCGISKTVSNKNQPV